MDGHGIGGASTLWKGPGDRKAGPGWPLGLSPTWLPEDRQVGPPIGQFCVAEHHDTVLSSFLPRALTDGVHPRDHLLFALVVAGLVVRVPRVKQQALYTSRPSPLGAASIWAGWALLTRFPKGSRLCTLALPADAAATVTADLPILGPARADVRRAVTIVPNVTCMALALSTVTLAVA
ncbi:AC133403.1 [Phodopus roborovskii]|uniref:AC133403.1 protein n=1 Tax=Phodopus roborovskii TaxID=109678 RepID=A0AAU9ZI93_PHORO|nr:AC133403.1 [Phodopus roborovskii]